MSDARHKSPELFNPNGTIVKPVITPSKVELIIVDLFCGAGGVTFGAEMAVDKHGNRLAVVVAGVNHDPLAIESHRRNHPETVHFIEDVRDKLLPYRILQIVRNARKLYPNAKIVLHGSLECTNFSNAKGGMTRDPDSRSLAEFMPFYLQVLKPDYFTIENVREFADWGPMEAKRGKTKEDYPFCYLLPVTEGKGKKKKVVGFQPHLVPIKEYKKLYFEQWRKNIEAMGYAYDSRIHNSADFGANTSRRRFYAVFSRPGLPVSWPEQTHAAKPEANPSKKLQKWRPIRECLELDDKGTSIFAPRKGRKDGLCEKSLERIFEGLIKHVGNGKREFLAKYFSGPGMTYDAENPAATVTTVDHQAIVQVEPFVTQSNGGDPAVKSYPVSRPSRTITATGNQALIYPQGFTVSYYGSNLQDRVKGMEEPAPTVTTQNRLALIQAESFCVKYHGSGKNLFGTDDPCSSITCKDRVGLINTEQFVSLQYSDGKQEQSTEDPASAITCNPKHRLVSAEFIDQQYSQSKPASIDDPAGAITVNPHLALVSAEAFVLDPQWFGMSRGIEEPHRTIIARQDKSPSSLVSAQYVQPAQFENTGASVDEPHPTITSDRHWTYLMTAKTGPIVAIIIHPADSPAMRKIKAFMVEYGIIDIMMRMLKVRELKLIQGFPEEYYLAGHPTDQKKFIGNSVTPVYAKALFTALGLSSREFRQKKKDNPSLSGVAA